MYVKSNRGKHALTALTTFVLWLAFLVLGLPSDYYQTWSLGSQIWLCVFALVLLMPIAYLFLDKVWKHDLVKSSAWIALYASVPLVVYDYIYVGMVKGLGHGYLLTHWYLTIFYFIVWIEIPLVGWLMQKWRAAAG